MASTSDSRAIGSWTLGIICQRVMPVGPAASTVVGDDAADAVGDQLDRDRDGVGDGRDDRGEPAGREQGQRRDQVDERRDDWKASRNGPDRHVALVGCGPSRPRATTASTITSTVATSVIASVIIVSFQRPVAG